MEDHIRATAHAPLGETADAGGLDLMPALAVPLPTIVMAKMIGLPEEDLDRFKDIGFGARRPVFRPTIVLCGLRHLDVRVRRRGALSARP